MVSTQVQLVLVKPVPPAPVHAFPSLQHSHKCAYRVCFSFIATPIPSCTAISSPPTFLWTSIGESRSLISISAVWSSRMPMPATIAQQLPDLPMPATIAQQLPLTPDGLHLRYTPACFHHQMPRQNCTVLHCKCLLSWSCPVCDDRWQGNLLVAWTLPLRSNLLVMFC